MTKEDLDLVVLGDALPSAATDAFVRAAVRPHEVGPIERAFGDDPGRTFESVTPEGVDCVLVTVDLSNPDTRSTLREGRTAFSDLPFVFRLADGEESVAHDEGPSAHDLLAMELTDFVRASDLHDRGELVADRIRTLVAAAKNGGVAASDTTSGDATSGDATFATSDDVTGDIARAVETLTIVQDATSDPGSSVEEKIDRIVDRAADRLGYPIGYVTRIESGEQHIVAATGGHELIQAGATDPLGETYCRKTIETAEPFVLEDALEEGWEDDPAFERFGLRCYLGARITVDGETYGTVCFADEQPRPGVVGDAQHATVEALARLLGYEIERHRRKSELERSRHRLQSLLEQAPDRIIIHDADGEITDANRAAVEALGYARDELLSMNVSDIEVGIDREELRERWRPMSDGPVTVEGVQQRNDGVTDPVEVWINDIELDGERRFIAIARDITDRKEYQRTLQEQRDRLDILNQVMRHDIRNDMQVVKGRSGILEKHVDDDGRRHLRAVQRSSDKVIELTKTARDLTKTMLQEDGQLQRIRLDHHLDTQLEAVQSAHSNAVLRTDGILPEVTVWADGMLEALFRNLLQNAVVHNDKDVPEVSVSADVDGELAIVRVADNGPGVPDSQKESIFGKGEKDLDSPGTGLGLYLVKTLVDDYGGDVWVEDNDPEGAVFVVELQVADGGSVVVDDDGDRS